MDGVGGVRQIPPAWRRQAAGVVEQRLEGGRHAVAIALDDKRGAIGGGRDINPGRTFARAAPPGGAAGALRVGEHGFDVFAGAEAVDAEIHAGADGDRRIAEGRAAPRYRSDRCGKTTS